MPNDDCSKRSDPDVEAVLEFWFGDPADPDNVRRRGTFWFKADENQDRILRDRFAGLHDSAQRGDLDHWTGDSRGTLALILLLDQFTRNLYRGTMSAFANDARALGISRGGISRGLDREVGVVERAFWYMPFQHSENLEDQRESVRLFQGLLDESPASFVPFSKNGYEFAVLHLEIIERFGRFPHRNELLGRASTDAERDYLQDGGHRFGQG